MAYFDGFDSRLIADFFYLQIMKDELATLGIELDYISPDGKQFGFSYKSPKGDGEGTAPTLAGILDVKTQIEQAATEADAQSEEEKYYGKE